MSNVNPTTIYLDCDDTILYSSEMVIRILNQRYGENKTISDLTDWFYQSIVPGVSQQEILGIYDSEEFWNEVELKRSLLVSILVFLFEAFLLRILLIPALLKRKLTCIVEFK